MGVGLPSAKAGSPAIQMRARAGSRRAPERPAAIATRPQFGSRPATIVFTSGEEAMVRAASRASRSSAAPSTATSISVLAPSPSRASSRASFVATSTIASASAGAAGWPVSTVSPPAAPLASAITMSQVELSMSTSSIPKLSAEAARSVASSHVGATGASVVRKANIVAMSGWIIPEPLAAPPTA